MKLRLVVIASVIAGGAWVWGADSKAALQQARAHYHQAVSAHGADSPEARAARQNLRAARQTFHAERREHTPRRPASPPAHPR